MPDFETLAKGTLATAATLSTVGAGLLWYGQNYLIYPSAFPPGSRTDVPTPEGLPYEDLTLKTSDKVLLRCFFIPQKKSYHHAADIGDDSTKTDDEFAVTRPTVVMFHGNGGNHGHRVPLARVFYLNMRCNVLMMSYRGYGLSEGSPSEAGLKIDAQTGLDFLTTHPVFSQTKIILYGQSIGGAVSIDLASRNPTKIRALILENTFTSLPSLIPHVLPVLGPFSFLCHQTWDSASKVPLIPASTPILMLSGVKDGIVPKEHMRALWEAVAKRGETKTSGGREYKVGLEHARFKEFPRGGHNDTCVQLGYWPTISDFVQSVTTGEPTEKN
ncbi:hypothetical protein C0991_004004 [Blastosporella zonata]|nr:hypothetical protein C0991_004004 [Blastosporella zonata]